MNSRQKHRGEQLRIAREIGTPRWYVYHGRDGRETWHRRLTISDPFFRLDRAKQALPNSEHAWAEGRRRRYLPVRGRGWRRLYYDPKGGDTDFHLADGTVLTGTQLQGAVCSFTRNGTAWVQLNDAFIQHKWCSDD